jgi:uncharacterized protein (TIGR02996 family)
MHDVDLLREIAAAPESAAPYLVYADTLLQRGDPRGELIIVQHALETADVFEALELRRREAALFEAHLEEWLGDLAQYRDCLIVRWARGFIHGARLRLRQPDHRPQMRLAALRALLDTPISALVVDLRLGPHKHAHHSTQPLVEELGARWPSALRRLHIGDTWSIDLEPLADARLDELSVDAHAIELWQGGSPTIRRLTVRQPAFDPRQLAGSWPALEELAIHCTTPGPLTWLVPERFPRLHWLALTGSSETDALAFELLEHPIVDQLVELDVSGNLGACGVAACAVLAKRTRVRTMGKTEDVGDAVGRAARLAPEAAHATLVAIERAWRRELSPDLRSNGAALHRELAKACEQLGDLAGAESWLWGATRHADWYGWQVTDELLDQIAAVQLRAGHVAAALPLRKRVVESFARTKPTALPRALLELSFVELARGRLAHAELDCRHALELVTPPPTGEPRERTALAALLWARHDVESTVRGAWLFALHQLGEVAVASAVASTSRPDQIIERHAQPRGEVLTRALLAELAMRRNQHQRAAEHIARALAVANEDVNNRAIALGVQARIAVARGDYGFARKIADEARELHHAADHHFGVAMQSCTMADAALGAASYRDARRHASEALALLVRDGEYPAIASVRLRLGQAAHLQGARDAAEHHYLAAIEDAERDRYLRIDHRTPLVPQREPELVGCAEIWLALLRAQDARPAEAYTLLGRARARIPTTNTWASETHAMASSVVARFAGSNVSLPNAKCLPSRLIAALLV